MVIMLIITIADKVSAKTTPKIAPIRSTTFQKIGVRLTVTNIKRSNKNKMLY